MSKIGQNKEIENHLQHIAVTFDKILGVLKIDEILNTPGILPDIFEQVVSERESWIKTCNLVVEGVTTEAMVLHHLLWLQSIGRIVIEDDDPYFGAVRLRVNVLDLLKAKCANKGKDKS